MISQFITKQEAITLCGWATKPMAGERKLWLLIDAGVITRPQHARGMFYRDEVLKAIERFGADIFFKMNDQKRYEIIISKAA